MATVTINGQTLSEDKVNVIIAALAHWDGWDPTLHSSDDDPDHTQDDRIWDDRQNLLAELRDRTPEGILFNGQPLNLAR